MSRSTVSSVVLTECHWHRDCGRVNLSWPACQWLLTQVDVTVPSLLAGVGRALAPVAPEAPGPAGSPRGAPRRSRCAAPPPRAAAGAGSFCHLVAPAAGHARRAAAAPGSGSHARGGRACEPGPGAAAGPRRSWRPPLTHHSPRPAQAENSSGVHWPGHSGQPQVGAPGHRDRHVAGAIFRSPCGCHHPSRSRPRLWPASQDRASLIATLRIALTCSSLSLSLAVACRAS